MSGPTSEALINQVKTAVDIVELVGEHVQLKKSGRNLVGLCPFHSEKTPSFHVNAERQFFHCFGCGKSGDIFSFVMELDHLTFPEALHQLAERAGIAVPQPKQWEAHGEDDGKRAMYEAHRLVATLYHQVLTASPYGQQALKYLQERGMSHQVITQFQLGFAPNSWDFVTRFLHKRGFDPANMVAAGLLARSESGRIFDRFRGRVMFPIHNSQGEVVGFGGRSLDGAHPKYMNSPETPLFNKSGMIFNLHRARSAIRKRNQAILFEGYVDVIAAWQAGIDNGVATLGTALTEQQARTIRRNAEQVTICYDGDAAGQEATAKAIDLLQEAGCSVRIAPLPQGMDPDEYIRQHGGAAFSQQVLLQAMPVTAFRLKHLRSQYVLKDEADQARYIQEAVEVISKLNSPVERDLYERQLASEFSLSLDALKQETRRAYKRQKLRERRDKLAPVWNNSINNGNFTLLKSQTLAPAHLNAERMLLYYMVRSKEVTSRVQQECKVDFSLDEHCALVAYLYAYYAEGYPADPGRFIHYVKDEKCKQLASGLAMMECKETVSDQEIDDYIRQVNNYPKRTQLQQLRAEQKHLHLQATQAVDEETKRELVTKAAIIGMRIVELENALKDG